MRTDDVIKGLLFGVVALAIALGLAWVLSPRSTRPELIYDGKPISVWASQALSCPSATMREEASAHLRELGTNAIPDLIRLLRTPNPFLASPVRFAARYISAKSAGRLYSVVNPLEAVYKRAAAAQALRNLGPFAQEAVPALRRALEDDSTVAWYAALALAQLQKPGLAALANGLSTTPSIQRGYVCYALGTQGPSSSNAIPKLVRLLENGDALVSEKAAAALGNMGRLAVPGLRSAMTSSKPAVRLLSIQALTTIGPLARDAIPDLVRMAKDDQPALREAALNALPLIRPTAPGKSHRLD